MNDQWRSFAETAIAQARAGGATYADIRIYPESCSEAIDVEGNDADEGRVAELAHSMTQGFGVRVLVDGAWGFYATDDLRESRIDDVVRAALENARANAGVGGRPVRLLKLREDEVNREYRYVSPCVIDPFSVPLDEKVRLLLAAERAMREASPRVFLRQGHLSFQKFRKILLTSDGVRADQTFTWVGAAVVAAAQRDRLDPDKQNCSHPSHFPMVFQEGWEAILGLDLVNRAALCAQEADEFLAAPETPSGIRHIILMPEQNNLHSTHETVHGFEGDRVVDKERTLAGGSFLTWILPRIGEYQFGSPAVTIIADSLTPGGVGTFACDDEGIPARRTVLVENGVWKGLLVSRECVGELNERVGRTYFTEASGAMRAAGPASFPLIRMNNIALAPGGMSIEEMKELAPIGTIIFGNNKSWSIDPYRRNFQFGSEAGWEKVSKNGSGVWEKRRNPIYRGDNLKFFRNCVAVGNKESAVRLGIGNCGKGVPVQSMATGHTTPWTWFKDIQVDSARSGRSS